MNKIELTNNKIFTFRYLVDKGLAVVIKVKDMEFKLVYDKLQGTENKKYYILVKDNEQTSYDIIGEETDYDEAELCFITEITRYDDLSYEEE